MRTRLKKYSDYGMTREEARKIIRYCRTSNFVYRNLVVSAAYRANPEIYTYLVENICDRVGWIESGVPIDERSFYGWRKRCIFFLKEDFQRLNIL